MQALKSLDIHFDGIQSPFSPRFAAKRWRIPGVDGPFARLPAAAKTLRISKRSVFMNHYSHAEREELSVLDAREWGLSEETRIVYAKAVAENGTRFCLRFILNAQQCTSDPHSNNFKFYSDMVKDARFHARNLQPVAGGLFVPMHYGMWIADTSDWAGIVLISITDWCGISWQSLRRTRYNTVANRLLIGRTFEMLHDIGVELNGSMENYRDFANVMLDFDDPLATEDVRLNGRARCYIAGFSKAEMHQCERRLPLLPLGTILSRDTFGCPELACVSFLLDLNRSNACPEYSVDGLLQWHRDYAAKHPEYPNASVLIAQRAALFPKERRVYPSLSCSFVDSDDVSSDLSLMQRNGAALAPDLFFREPTREQVVMLIWGKEIQWPSRRKPSSSSSIGLQWLARPRDQKQPRPVMRDMDATCHRSRRSPTMSSDSLREIVIKIDGVQPPYTQQLTARRWRIPGVAGPFSRLPPSATLLRVSKHSMFMNRYSSGERCEISLSEVREWGLAEETRIVYAKATSTDGGLFCLRFILNAEVSTRKPDSHTFHFYRNLVQDAKFYAEELQFAASILVPIHYGMWIADTGSWAGTALISITQWCGTSWRSLMDTKFNTLENRLLVGRVFEIVHDLGIELNGNMSNTEDFANVMLDLDDPLATEDICLRGGARCYVVGFANARIHRCRRKLPLLPLGSLVSRTTFGCSELAAVSFFLQFGESSVRPDLTVAEISRWHDQYAEKHADYCNAALIMAQRAALFPDQLRVYPSLKANFEDPDNHMSRISLLVRDGGTLSPRDCLESRDRDELCMALWVTWAIVSLHAIATHPTTPYTMQVPKSIEIHFEGIEPPYSQHFTAKSWRIPTVDGPFTRLPSEAKTFRVSKRSVYMNHYSSGERGELSLSEAREWGLSEETRIVYAKAVAVDGRAFCLRFILNAQVATRDSSSRTSQFYSNLVQDAKFYTQHLRFAAGLIVPIHFGMWLMDTGEWAGKVLVSITQWCGTSWRSLMDTKYDTLDNRLHIGQLFEILHDLGIELDGGMSNKEDFANVMLDFDDPLATEEVRLSGRTRCYVVGFAHANIHRCERKLPLLPLGSVIRRHIFGCPELAAVSLFLGFAKSSARSDLTVADISRWHDEYAAKHGDYCNATVLMAQRLALFPQEPRVYPSLMATFVKPFVDPCVEMPEVFLSIRNGGNLSPRNMLQSRDRDDLDMVLFGRAVKPVRRRAPPSKPRKSDSSSSTTSSGSA
uniref:Fungal-type protein kinase domain-containing protein n=1 Tax=Mycena chlorophos TaxID=658473 RepID=A0ABQ0LMI1_MYCCL|nr:predicted protein [Mycena chlorophos]